MNFKNEAEFEQYFVEQVENAGGRCMKCNPMKMGKGIPDRLVSFNDTFGLVELKNTHGTGVVTPEQKNRLNKFKDNGVKSYVVDNVEDISKVIFEIKNYKDQPKNIIKRKNEFSVFYRITPFFKQLEELENQILEKDPNFFRNNKGFKTCWDLAKFYRLSSATIPLCLMKLLAECFLYDLDFNLVDWCIDEIEIDNGQGNEIYIMGKSL